MATLGQFGGARRRHRVEQLLDQRWTEPLVTIIAGAGSGKTTAIRHALEQNRAAPKGLDLVAGADADTGWPGVLATLGQQLLEDFADVDSLCSWVAGRAPRQVTITIDDAHLLDDFEPLATLSSRLPGNGHLLLSSRHSLPLDDGVVIDERDLEFDDEEIDEIAREAAWTRDDVLALGRSPAEIAMGITRGEPGLGPATADAVWSDVSPALRPALDALVVLGRVDDGLLDALGISTSARELATSLPLVSHEGDEAIAHDLLRTAALPRVASADEIRRQAAAALSATGSSERAAALLAEMGEWDAALDALATSPLGVLSDAGMALAQRWLDRVPGAMISHPTVRLFQAVISRRQDPSQPEVLAALTEAAEGFRNGGQPQGELSALTMLGYLHARVHNDLGALAGVHARVVELHEQGCANAVGLAMLGNAVVEYHLGDPSSAAHQLERLPRTSLTPEWRGIADWYHTIALLDLGRPHDAAAVGAANEDDAELPFEQARLAHLWPLWSKGEVVEVRDELVRLVDEAESRLPRERVDTGLFATGLLAATGDLPNAHRGARLVRDHLGDDDLLVAGHFQVGLAYLAVIEGDEARARDLLRGRFPNGYRAPADQRDIARLVALAYVCDDDARSELDELEWRGCWQESVDLARTLVESRAGKAPDWDRVSWDAPGTLVSVLGLRWSLELACRAHHDGHGPARGACSSILEMLPTASLRILDTFRDAEAPTVRKGSAALLAALPVPPGEPIRVHVLGPTTLLRAGEAWESKDWARERVRALLSLLVVHRKVSRERAMGMLWPDLPTDRAQANLRVTLNYLNGVLAPDRPKNAATWTLRSEDQQLRLVDDDSFAVDLWEFDSLADAAERLEAAGKHDAAIRTRLDAIALWRGDPLVEVMYDEWAQPELERLRNLLLRQLVRAAEVLPVLGRAHEAIALANRALGLQPSAENAGRALVAAHLSRADIGSARAAYARVCATLDDLGFSPEPATKELGSRLGVV